MNPEIHTCSFCSRIVSEQDKRCPGCGFPLSGTQEQKEKFIEYREHQKASFKKYKFGVRMAAFVVIGLGVVKLIVVGLMLFAGGFVQSLELPYFSSIAESLITGLALIILGIAAIKKPFPFLIAGLSLYIVTQFFEGDIFNVSFSTLIIRILVTIVVLRGIIYSKKYKFEPNKYKDEILHDEL